MKVNFASNIVCPISGNFQAKTVCTLKNRADFEKTADLSSIDCLKSYSCINFRAAKSSQLPVNIIRKKEVPDGWVGVYNKNELKSKLSENKNVILMNDIKFEEDECWQPIGSEENPFKGKLDGNGHKISNLSIHKEKAYCVGFFGSTDNAEIKNLIFEKVNIDTINSTNVGAIAGRIDNNSQITNCNVSGNICGYSVIGGICGGNRYFSSVKNCIVNAEVSGIETVGGICAENFANSLIKNCEINGKVYGDMEIGGIAGVNIMDSTIKNCSSNCKINGSKMVGGLAAVNTHHSKIENCKTSYEHNSPKRETGTFVGENSADSIVQYNAAVSNNTKIEYTQLIGRQL